MDDLCTVNETFAGVPLGDCGSPAVGWMVWSCGEGHREASPICDAHLRLATGEFLTFCAPCREAGQTSQAYPSEVATP